MLSFKLLFKLRFKLLFMLLFMLCSAPLGLTGEDLPVF